MFPLSRGPRQPLSDPHPTCAEHRRFATRVSSPGRRDMPYPFGWGAGGGSLRRDEASPKRSLVPARRVRARPERRRSAPPPGPGGSQGRSSRVRARWRRGRNRLIAQRSSGAPYAIAGDLRRSTLLASCADAARPAGPQPPRAVRRASAARQSRSIQRVPASIPWRPGPDTGRWSRPMPHLGGGAVPGVGRVAGAASHLAPRDREAPCGSALPMRRLRR